MQLVHLFQLYLLSSTLRYYLSLTSFVLFLSLDPCAYTIITKITSLHPWFNVIDLNLSFKLLPVTMSHIKAPAIQEKKRIEHFKVFLFLAFVNLDIYVLDCFVLMVVSKWEEANIKNMSFSADTWHEKHQWNLRLPGTEQAIHKKHGAKKTFGNQILLSSLSQVCSVKVHSIWHWKDMRVVKKE